MYVLSVFRARAMFGLLCCPWKCTSLSECTRNAVVFGCFHFLYSTFPVSIFSCFYFSRDRTEVGKCNCLNEFFHITQILIEIVHYFHVINENMVAKWSPCFTVLARSLRTMLLLSNHRSKKEKKKEGKKKLVTWAVKFSHLHDIISFTTIGKALVSLLTKQEPC